MALYDKNRSLLDTHEDEILHLLTRQSVLNAIIQGIEPRLKGESYTIHEEYMRNIIETDTDSPKWPKPQKKVDVADYWCKATLEKSDQSTVAFWLIVDLNVASARRLIERLRIMRNAAHSSRETTVIMVAMRPSRAAYDLILESGFWALVPQGQEMDLPVDVLPERWVLSTLDNDIVLPTTKQELLDAEDPEP